MAGSDFDMSSLVVPSMTVGGVKFSKSFDEENAKQAMEYRACDNDLVLITYPKCGTTWAQLVIGNLMFYGDFNGDLAGLEKRCPFLELSGTKHLKPGSFYKKHLPFNEKTFNPNARYVFVTRNPRDVAVSFYHFTMLVPPPIEGLPEGANWFPRFAELFVNGDVWYGDYMEFHRNWLEGLRKFGKPENILIVVYEKMKADPRGELIRIANFLGGEAKELVKDDEVVENILKRTSVDSMKKTLNKSFKEFLTAKHGAKYIPEGAEFVRKGVVGDHVNHFTPEISKMFDNYIASDPRNKEIMDMFDL